MWILNQNRTEIYPAEKFKFFNVVECDGYAAIFSRLSDERETGVKLGKYYDARDAKYVLAQLFDALAYGASFEFPAKTDIPETRFTRDRGSVTSRKASHGHS